LITLHVPCTPGGDSSTLISTINTPSKERFGITHSTIQIESTDARTKIIPNWGGETGHADSLKDFRHEHVFLAWRAEPSGIARRMDCASIPSPELAARVS
jgi:hypothetical protein